MKLNWAERWAVNNPLRVIQQTLEIAWMRRALEAWPGGRFLEVGCGRGVGARLVMRFFGPDLLHATDLDLLMVKRARSYPGPGRDRKVRLVVADAGSLPYPPSTFNAVFGFGVMHHVVDWREALGELARVLVPGGYYFFEELFPPVYANYLTKRILLHPREDRFDSQKWREALDEAGFVLVRSLENSKVGAIGIAKLSPHSNGHEDAR
jgi:ubiquinone/menaquinone biosynthesis C-methylase UbiE